MSEFFPFKPEHTLISQENIIWSDQDVVEKHPISHFASTNISENECFVTSDGTEYLSELETTNEIAFGDLHNLALETAKIDIAENVTECNDEGSEMGNQVFVFKIDESDDLYGVQVVQGEDGKIEKYQFKFGTNEKGELEAIPDTIELLPNDDHENKGDEELATCNEMHEASEEMYLEKEISEPISENIEALTDDVSKDPFETFDNEISEDVENTIIRSINIKEELINTDSCHVKEELNAQNCKIEVNEEYEYANTNDIEISEDMYNEQVTESEMGEEDTSFNEYEEIFIENQENEEGEMDDSHDVINNEVRLIDPELNDDEFQIIDGLHVTADSSHVEMPESENILQNALEQSNNSNILKQYCPRINTDNNVDKVLYYILPPVQQEKENVNNSLICKPIKTNPRSILKSSYTLPILDEIVEYDERLEKRYAKSKEAVQARLFHNFITKTTIPQAPVRNVRLPRKQEIKPVNERVDEEIIVQEVMVSSNGVIETIDNSSKIRRDNLTVTEYVELTDSDDENVKDVHKNNGAETDSSVIEIFNSDEEIEETPKKRGRPRKINDSNVGAINNEQGIIKKKRGRPSNDQIQSKETKFGKVISSMDEIKCPSCPKTFPNQNSLNTHIQHHNLENSLLSSKQTKPKLENHVYKHKCEMCGNTFKNTILLNRHICTAENMKKLECNICKHKFTDITRLNIHKRMHVKEKMLKTTSTLRISPNKCPPDPLKISKIKQNSHSCFHCSKVFSTVELLRSHSPIHRKFKCSNCTKSFSSRILLDTHVRENCVKYKSPKSRRLSFKTKRISFNKRRSSILKPRMSVLNSTELHNSTAVCVTPRKNVILNCEKCSSTFKTYTDLFKHNVVKHGLDTPDKTVLLKPKQSLCKQASHSGIPVNDRLKKAYAGFKEKLELSKIL